MITPPRVPSVCVWQFSEVSNALTQAWQECIFLFYLLFTYIFLRIDYGKTALLRYDNERYSCVKNVSHFQNARYNKIISLLRKSVCFQNSQLSECLFKNNVASFVNPAFSKIPECRNYMPKFCRFGIIAISSTAATWKLNNAWMIERGNGELKTERSTR